MSSGKLSISAAACFGGAELLVVVFRPVAPLAADACLVAAGPLAEACGAAESECALFLGDRFDDEPCVVEDLGSRGFFGADMGGILQELHAPGKDITRSAKPIARLICKKHTHKGFNSIPTDC